MKDERAWRYVTGEMAAQERAAFEECLRTDLVLREHVASLLETRDLAKDWYASPAPGEERLNGVSLPALAVARAGSKPRGRYAAQLLSAILIFAAGFLVGERGNFSIPRTATTSPVPAVATPATTPAATPTVTESKPEPAPEPVQPEMLRTKEENGRVVVETVLKSTGSRATWVIDGEFQIAQSAVSSNGKDQ